MDGVSNPDHSGTPQQRAGTPPFMAHGLLDRTDRLHLYRHDVESIFCVMLILATHYEIQAPKEGKGGGVRMRKGKFPFQRWFDAPNYNILSAIKSTFFVKGRVFEVSPSFQDLHGWLLKLQKSFRHGFAAKEEYKDLLEDRTEGSPDEDTPAAFDEETLGGHVTYYSAIINPTRALTGLKGLVIRYDPSPPSQPRRVPPKPTLEMVPANAAPLPIYLPVYFKLHQ